MKRIHWTSLWLLTTLALGTGHATAQCAPAIIGSLVTPVPDAVSVAVQGNFAYVVENAIGGTLEVIDVSNPASPTTVGSVAFVDVPRAIVVDGSYAYVAVRATGLHVVDISTPSSPTIVGSVQTNLTGPTEASAVAIQGSIAYVANRAHPQNGEFHLVDVSIPTSPSIVGSATIPNASGDVAVNGNVAYVGGSGYYRFFDVSNPAAPVQIHAGGFSNLQQAFARSGTDLFFSHSTGVLPVDAANPASPTQHALVSLPFAASSLFVAGQRLYLAGQSQFAVMDISDPTAPSLLGTLATPGTARDVVVQGSLAYLADGASGLQVIDVLSCDPPPEYASENVAVGANPCDVVAKDLDGDGAPDLATADSGADTVTVLTNDGSGGFGGAPNTIALAGGSTPAALAGGDLVTGGGCDLAVAAQDGDAVIIIDNDGAGTFVVDSTLSTSPYSEPVGIDAGDLNGGGTDDVVVAMQGDVLVPGTGGIMVSMDGGALTALTAPAGGFLRPQRVVICDLDGDGDNDIAATMMGSGFSPSTTDNVLLYENVAGVFGAPITLSVAQNPRGICCGDFEYDGDTDLAVTAEDSPFLLPGSIEVFENTGLTPGAWSTGDFTSGGSFTGGTLPSALAHADLRDDSIPGFCALHDLIAINFGSENLTRFDEYDATGDAFSSQEDMTAGAVPVAIRVADFNGDKVPDLVVANKGAGNVTVMTAQNPALEKAFGAGCAGTGGLVPAVAAVGLPQYGSVFGIQLSNARAFAPTIFALSLDQQTSAFGPCNLYLGSPIITLLTLTNGSGDATIGLNMPAAGPFDGCDIFFQFAVFDTNGAYASAFAFSDALRTKLGN